MKRLTPAFVTLLMFAVVGVLVVAYVGKRLFAREEEPPPVSTRNIPVAIVEIEPGTLITEAHMGVAPIKVSAIDPQTLVSERVIVGRVAKQQIAPLQQIRTDDLYPPGESLPIEISEENRAVSVALRQDVAMVDGLIRPGQHVDVHFTPNTDDERMKGGMTMTLFKGVRLVAMNRSFRPTNQDRAGNTATFELTPEQANVLLLAKEHGDITLTYNPEGAGDGGVAVSSENRAYLEEILGLEPLPEPEPPFVSDHYNGSSRSTHQFRDGREIGGGVGTISNPSTPDAPTSNGSRSGGADRADDDSRRRRRPAPRPDRRNRLQRSA